MGIEQGGMMLVRADLCARLESLQALSDKVSGADFHARIASIRTLAAAYGLTPVVRLADALESAARQPCARNARNCSASLYLGRLRDAIGCEPLDEKAGEAILASIAVRLGA